MNRLLITIAAILLSACSSSPQSTSTSAQRVPEQDAGLCHEHLSKSVGMQISMARQAFQRGQYYSSLASLEKINSDGVTKRALQASAFRKAGELEKADDVYRTLLSTCLKGNAEHGLGLISAYQGDMKAAQTWLASAAKTEPANPNIRNDYGFLLLSIGEESRARAEFITALELDPNNKTAAKNLWLVLFLNHETKAMESLNQRFNWDQTERKKLTLAATQFSPINMNDHPVKLGKENQ